MTLPVGGMSVRSDGLYQFGGGYNVTRIVTRPITTGGKVIRW